MMPHKHYVNPGREFPFGKMPSFIAKTEKNNIILRNKSFDFCGGGREEREKFSNVEP